MLNILTIALPNICDKVNTAAPSAICPNLP